MTEVVAAVIFRNNLVLITNRPPGKAPRGWEFPGGKVEPGETLQQALARELREELALPATIGEEICHLISGDLSLHFILAEIPEMMMPHPQEGQNYRWSTLHRKCEVKLLENDLPFWLYLAATHPSKRRKKKPQS